MTAPHPRFSAQFYTTDLLTGIAADRPDGLPHDRCYVWRPRFVQPHMPGIIVLHGAGATALNWPTSTALAELAGRFTGAGCMVISPDIGDFQLSTGFGSGVASWGTTGPGGLTDRLHRWKLWLVSQGCAASKIGVLSHSMGGYNAHRYAVDYPADVAAMVAFNPFIDIATARANRGDPTYGSSWSTLAASFDTTWGITASDPTPVLADVFQSNVSGTPWLAYYCPNDPFIPSSWISSMAAHVGANAQIVNAGNSGHFAFAPLAGTPPAIDPEPMISFVMDHLRDAA